VISLPDLVKALTVEQLRTTLLATLTTLGFPATSWHLGAVIRTIVSLFAATLSPFTDLLVLVAKSGFLDWAEGVWLDLVAEQVYSTPRNPALPAAGTVTLNNSAGGSFGPYAPKTWKVFNPATGKVYWNTETFSLAPLETDKVVAIEAVEVGSGSTSNAGTITGIETSMPGVACSNAAALLGFDAESDANLRIRCRLKLASLSPNGPAEAYQYVALSYALNGGVTVTRTRPVLDSATGQSTLYVAGPSGALSGPDVAKIQTAIGLLCKPLGFDCTVVSATNKSVSFIQTVYVYSALNLLTAEVQAAVEAELDEWILTMPIGGDFIVSGSGKLFVNAAEATIMRARTTEAAGQQIHQVQMTTPAADVALLASEVVVKGAVSTGVIQVAA